MSATRAVAYDAYLVGCNILLRLPGHRLRRAVLVHLVGAEVAPDASIQRGVRIMHKGGLRIGSGTNVNARVTLDARGGLTIGARVNISPEVMILTAEHDPASRDFAGRDRPVVIGDRAWIATRAIVLPGAEIGAGGLVAAGAVVRGVVPPGAIMAGNPARQIGTRPPDAQADLPRYRRWFH